MWRRYWSNNCSANQMSRKMRIATLPMAFQVRNDECSHASPNLLITTSGVTAYRHHHHSIAVRTFSMKCVVICKSDGVRGLHVHGARHITDSHWIFKYDEFGLICDPWRDYIFYIIILIFEPFFFKKKFEYRLKNVFNLFQ